MGISFCTTGAAPVGSGRTAGHPGSGRAGSGRGGAPRSRAQQPLPPAGLSPAAAAYAVLPPGHPQGYQDCFDAFVADTYRAVAGEDVDGLPTFADGARAGAITDAVLASAASGRWVDVTPAAMPAPAGTPATHATATPATARPADTQGGARP